MDKLVDRLRRPAVVTTGWTGLDLRLTQTHHTRAGEKVTKNPPGKGEIVAYLSGIERGKVNIKIIALGRVKGPPERGTRGMEVSYGFNQGVVREEGERRAVPRACWMLIVPHQRLPTKHIQLVIEYLVNKEGPFDLMEPFGLYRDADNHTYDDVVPLRTLKASEVKRSEHRTHTLTP